MPKKIVPMSMRMSSSPATEDISVDDLLVDYHCAFNANLRFGQFACNVLDDLPKPWNELFYEEDTINAMEMLKEYYGERK